MKHFAKARTVGLALLVFMVVILSACSSNSNNKTNETASGGNTQTSTEPSATDSGKKLPRVAFVYIGPPGDGGWTFEHDNGRKYMEEKLGIKADTVENVPESADAERVITELAQNHDIIFTTSFGYMDPTLNVAKKFPNVKFMHTAGYKTADNMSTYFGKNYEASYLTGIAAGKMTKSNVIGYVGAFPIPEVIYNINAFALGIQSVNPDAKVDVVWSNTWYDPTAERQAAISLLDKGADVLLAYQDSPATLQAAAERGALAGGNDSDMTRYAPDAYLTNPTWNWGPYYTKVVQSVIDGTWKSEQFSGDMVDGMVGLAPLGPSIPDDVKKLVEDAKAKIISGELDVFSGPITDASGAAKQEAGQTMSLEQILEMNWFVKGVEGTIPQ
ncbi:MULTISPECIES: BMP family ABC transporter substrate-binding protein [Paenibacillus]|uniref:BMP family ABC transporter substrate-binding protein n=1 Tax=Paenibacillus glycanilyticus TaxID=126569 RepID=A0ABQ6NVJ2_9BACL|nr:MULTISPECIES: BMP family ABC transporter substrate-binding protein [Paenibacillus]MCK9861407.1 BMP family ABC transporter substrate-binding protein [Paenibacillus sp. ATY16]GMK48262.1 BMP family ABC transporter substrate-binding protein [Paenibacillus glycanilyticus]